LKDYVFYSCTKTPFGFLSPLFFHYKVLSVETLSTLYITLQFAHPGLPPGDKFFLELLPLPSGEGWSGVISQISPVAVHARRTIKFFGDLTAENLDPMTPVIGVESNGDRWLLAHNRYAIRRSDFDVLPS
jgi:hypothetical protein